MRHWREKSNKLAKKGETISGRKLVPWDDRMCGLETDGCAATSHWDQSPARRQDTVLLGGLCCIAYEQV